MKHASAEVEVPDLSAILAARVSLMTDAAALAYCRRDAPSYAQAAERWLLDGHEVWLLNVKGAPAELELRVRGSLVEASFPQGRDLDAIVSDIRTQADFMARYLESPTVSLTLYSRAMFLGIDYFREMKRATPHTDSHARLVSALIGEGTVYAPRSRFDLSGIKLFHDKWDQHLAAYDRAGTNEERWAAIGKLQRAIARPDFINVGTPERLPEFSVGVFDVRGKDRREDRFWHWIPYTPEQRLILNVDPPDLD